MARGGVRVTLLSILHYSSHQNLARQVTLLIFQKNQAQKSSLSRAIELDLNAATALSYPELGLLVMRCRAAVSLVFVKST